VIKSPCIPLFYEFEIVGSNSSKHAITQMIHAMSKLSWSGWG